MTETQLDLTADPVRSHVEMIHRLADGVDGVLVVSVFNARLASDNGTITRHPVGDVDGMVAAIEAHSTTPGMNVYAGLQVMRRDLPRGKRGGEKDVVAVLGLVADMDADTGNNAGEYPIEPNYVIETSPGNLQPFWLFDRPVAPDVAKEIARGLKTATGSDHGTGDIAHVWRVPGTKNWPNAKKLARGRPECPAAVTVSVAWDGALTDPAVLALAVAGQSRSADAAPVDLGELPDVDGIEISPKAAALLGADDVGDRSDHAARVVEKLAFDGHPAEVACALFLSATGDWLDRYPTEERARDDFARLWGKYGIPHVDARIAAGNLAGHLSLGKSKARLVHANDNRPGATLTGVEHNGNYRLENLTEDDVAQRFAELYFGKLRYCHSTGSWFEWTDTHWRRNETGRAFHFTRLLGRELSAGSDKKAIGTVRKKSFAAGVETFAQRDPQFAVTIDVWDQDPFLLGTPGGTIDLRTGTMRPATPSEGITKLTSVAPAAAADCPLWLRFLSESTGDDTELIRFLQQWCGYSLTGDTREHALVFIHGGGGNGKSVFLNTVTNIMADYATTAAMDTFTASRSDKHPTDLAMLRGARLVTASETEEGKAWAEARIKQMTGGDTISARFMRQDFFSFKPAFKLCVIGNHKPVLQNVDDAARRRFNIVPFIRKPAKPDRELEAKLLNEAPAILRWMVDGCLDWQANGLVRPSSITEATEAYFSEQDLFAQWLEDTCRVERDNTHLFERTVDLFASWRVYAENAGESPLGGKAFAERMRRNGFHQKRKATERGFTGVKLTGTTSR